MSGYELRNEETGEVTRGFLLGSPRPGPKPSRRGWRARLGGILVRLQGRLLR
jgi:hypothetical protein